MTDILKTQNEASDFAGGKETGNFYTNNFSSMIQQWEYKTESFSVYNTDTLNERGLEGWELCGLIELYNQKVRGIFKRPIPQPSTAQKIFNEVKNEVEGGHMEVKTTS